jgi:hypothetical protein
MMQRRIVHDHTPFVQRPEVLEVVKRFGVT